ncbi:hypothetical protein Ndes2526B_g02606 [Nannochloris sp. 'desiccata']|nr:putative Granule-bound starch synthase 1, chloroplastic/amyloplastic [Chlorella desiccata (nom. nud.)]
MATCVSASSNDNRERLRVVFISTEVAPWSKVGGLADVLASLPTALAARGHTVVTVAPRYLEYPDTTPTGIAVPLDLPPASSTISSGSGSPLKVESTPSKGVTPPHSPRRRRRGRRRRGQEMHRQRELLEQQVRQLALSSTNNNIASNESKASSSLPSRLPSHADLFHTKQGGVERVFVDHPALRTEDIYGGNASGGGSLTYMEAGDLDGLELRYNILCQAAIGAAALMPELQQNSDSDSGSTRGGIVFIANDWPTALQLLRLQYIIKRQRINTDTGHSESDSSPNGDSFSSSFEYSELLTHRLFTAATAMCIHNLAYQGMFPASVFNRLCLPDEALGALDSHSDWKSVLEELETGSTVFSSVVEGDTLAARCLCLPTKPCTCPEDSPLKKQQPLSLKASSQSSTTSPSEENFQQLVGDLNFMRAGLLCADEVITVSPTYAQEIQTQPDMGCGLQDILIKRGVTGIMNGIDTHEWDPASDPLLPKEGRYGIKNMVTGKAVMKKKLQRRLGLEENPDAALVVFVGRLTEQKGLDVLLGAVPTVLAGAPTPAPVRYQLQEQWHLEDLASSKLDQRYLLEKKYKDDKNRLQIAMLGTGESWIQAALKGLELSFQGQAVGVTAFSEELAHWLLAAADYVIVPSRFEPCGLVAQCGVRYGAVPLVAAVGGLKDLVQPGIGYTLRPLRPPGDALSHRADVDGLAELLRRVEMEAGTYTHRSMQRNCMEAELSWKKPAVEWETVIARLSKKHAS